MQSAQEFVAGFETCFKGLSDKRQDSKVSYPLIEILFLTIVAVAGNARTWEEIETFGETHLEALQEYYLFEQGVPSDDTIRRAAEMLDPEECNKALNEYFAKGIDLSGKHISIDGKSVRGSGHNGEKMLHLLHVYASDSGLVLCSRKVDTKTNEIVAIPDALDLLDIKGAIVTIDAMGCQKDIAGKIRNKGADYILGLKGNQGRLHAQVEDAFKTCAVEFFSMAEATTMDKGHGRIERRRCRMIRDLSKIPSIAQWTDISTVIEIKRTVTSKGKTTESTNYYISSCNTDATDIMKSIRSHWAIESMHWMLDVSFKEDASSMHKGNIPANMAMMRRLVFNILHGMQEKRQSKPKLLKMIGWSDNYLHKFARLLIFHS